MKINVSDMEWIEASEPGFSSQRKQLGAKAGGKKLGTSLFRLLPGEKAFPFHAHYANEEAIFVLSGQGSMRLGEETITLEANDYVALPCGKEHAHQVINTASEPLIYLCISTMIEPEVMEYPDSGKVGIMTGSAPGGSKTDDSQKEFYKKETAVSYFTDEE